jgi:hypothetical protein
MYRTYLLTLLRLFPELKHLTLHSHLSSVMEPNTLFPFFEQAKLGSIFVSSFRASAHVIIGHMVHTSHLNFHAEY